VPVRSKAQACGCSIAGIAGSNTAEGMDVVFDGWCVCNSLCDELFSRSEESYRLCAYVCNLETSTMKLSLLELDCQATGQYNNCSWSKFEMKLLIKFVVHYKCLEWNKLSNSRLLIIDTSTKFHLYLSKGKGKVHPCTGTEALYRPYGP